MVDVLKPIQIVPNDIKVVYQDFKLDSYRGQDGETKELDILESIKTFSHHDIKKRNFYVPTKATSIKLSYSKAKQVNIAGEVYTNVTDTEVLTGNIFINAKLYGKNHIIKELGEEKSRDLIDHMKENKLPYMVKLNNNKFVDFKENDMIIACRNRHGGHQIKVFDPNVKGALPEWMQ